MQTKTEIDRAALMASIEKWERNAQAKTYDDVMIGPNHCALCRIYLDNDCTGCPISSHTNKKYCKDTPYLDCEGAFDDWDLPLSRQRKCRNNFQAAARAEVDFLRVVLAELPE